METRHCNTLGQPIGSALPDWQACSPPSHASMTGTFCELVALDPVRHGHELYKAFAQDASGGNWTYLAYGPFDGFEAFNAWLKSVSQSSDLFYVILDSATRQAVGLACYMRIDPAMGVVEVGNIHFSPSLQKTPLATEAMFLMMKHVFDDLGYRRYEWKCDSCNEPSRKAALRFGFTFEGIFRQALVYKQRNRDTAWYSILDKEWPRQKRAFECWLSADNFDSAGRQKRRLQECLE